MIPDRPVRHDHRHGFDERVAVAPRAALIRMDERRIALRHAHPPAGVEHAGIDRRAIRLPRRARCLPAHAIGAKHRGHLMPGAMIHRRHVMRHRSRATRAGGACIGTGRLAHRRGVMLMGIGRRRCRLLLIHAVPRMRIGLGQRQRRECQPARDLDPRSASNIDPSGRMRGAGVGTTAGMGV